MKKIFLLIAITILTSSCSKSSSEETQVNNTPSELLGTWRYTGYYDDIATGSNDNNFHLYDESFLITFNSNGTYQSNFNNTLSNGAYTVNNDSVLNCNFSSTASFPVPFYPLKIVYLTNSILRTTNSTIPNPMESYQFEKIVNSPTISGKK